MNHRSYFLLPFNEHRDVYYFSDLFTALLLIKYIQSKYDVFTFVCFSPFFTYTHEKSFPKWHMIEHENPPFDIKYMDVKVIFSGKPREKIYPDYSCSAVILYEGDIYCKQCLYLSKCVLGHDCRWGDTIIDNGLSRSIRDDIVAFAKGFYDFTLVRKLRDEIFKYINEGYSITCNIFSYSFEHNSGLSLYRAMNSSEVVDFTERLFVPLKPKNDISKLYELFDKKLYESLLKKKEG